MVKDSKSPLPIKSAAPLPDDPQKRFTEWEGLGDTDPAVAARKRAEALKMLRRPPLKRARQEPEERTHGEEDHAEDTDPRRRSEGQD